MHNNLIIDLMDLPDLVATDLIHTEEYLFFVAIPKVDHVKCPVCGKRAVPKKLNNISKYSRKTERFKLYFLKQTDGRDYSRVARENDLSYTSIKNSVNTQIDTMIEKAQLKTLDKVEAISIDEFAIKKKHKYAVALTDPINGKLIEVLSSRKKKDLINYFNSWPDKLREQIKYFSMDMWSPYKAVAEEVFPNAK